MDSPVSTGAMRARLRREGTDAARLGPDPLAAFCAWHADWIATAPFDPMLAVLATVDADGMPQARAMDFVAVDHGFVFMTHGDSPKARELAAHPRAALCMTWPEIGRQIRVSGLVQVLADAQADAAFLHLPPSIRNVARATHQGQPLPDRAALEARIAATPPTPDPTRPAAWLGQRLIPLRIEFWQQRPADVQDRIEYRRDTPDAPWQDRRLSP